MKRLRRRCSWSLRIAIGLLSGPLNAPSTSLSSDASSRGADPFALPFAGVANSPMRFSGGRYPPAARNKGARTAISESLNGANQFFSSLPIFWHLGMNLNDLRIAVLTLGTLTAIFAVLLYLV